MAVHAMKTPMKSSAFRNATLLNLVWINISGLPRYFLVVIPMLKAAFPDNTNVVPVDLSAFGIWGLWTVIFVLASTSFLWMYLDRYGNSIRNSVYGGLIFGVVSIALTWVGIGNMGLAPFSLFWVATPLAIAEQIISGFIVRRAKKLA